MTWDKAVAGPLRGATCLWQDLDGLHVEAAPAAPPPTSIMWGWLDSGRLVRLRLDGDTAFVAVLDAPSATQAAPTVPWSADDGRVASAQGRGPSQTHGGAGTAYEQVIDDGISSGTGQITYIRPAAPGKG
jgi:hypothetical protein